MNSNRAEAEKQRVNIPTRGEPFADWRSFAQTVDGDALFGELSGTEQQEWKEYVTEFRESGHWNGDLLGLRILLFQEANNLHYLGNVRTAMLSKYELVENMLHEIARLTGQNYESDPKNYAEVVSIIQTLENARKSDKNIRA